MFNTVAEIDQPSPNMVVLKAFNNACKELGVSRHHAIIQAHRDRIAIKDFNSSNGTYINDYVLKPMFSYRLQDGDVVQLGKLKLTVEFLPDPS